MATPSDPYVGPKSFQPDDRPFFFGREREASVLVSLVLAHSEVLLYAQSGAGKTSLVNAHLIPLLREQGCDVLPLARVQGPLPPGTVQAQVPNLYVFQALQRWAEPSSDRPPGQTLASFLASRERPRDDDGLPRPRVIVFDQFEELFTYYPARWPDREDFFRQVREALDADPALRTLFTMREDHVAELDPYAALLPEKLRTRFRLERLREPAARAAIVEPVGRTERRFDDGVAERLLRDLLEVEVEAPDGGTCKAAAEFVEPVQLQVVCQSLWRSLKAEDVRITAEHLKAYGDVDQALSRFYEDCVRDTVSGAGVREGDLRRWFEERLITAQGTRGLVVRGQQDTGGLPNQAVDRLEDLHLIRPELRGRDRWYELAHDRFIVPIRDANRAWENTGVGAAEVVRRRLEARADEWLRAGHDPARLLREAELLEAERGQAALDDVRLSYTPTALRFLEASRKARDEERRRAGEERSREESDRSRRIDRDWLRAQVDRYSAVRPHYERLAEVLRTILEMACVTFAPQALVQARAKAVPAFAEKALRKRDQYADPISGQTDLCGARVVAHTPAEVEAVCAFIRNHFEVDESASLDAADRTRAREFGYRSAQCVVRLAPGKFPTPDVPVTPPPDTFDLRAEIQVRTLLQHCWAKVVHHRLYRAGGALPSEWEGESARVAALLESADQAIARLIQASAAPLDLEEMPAEAEEIRERAAILEAVFELAPDSGTTLQQLIRGDVALGDWEKAEAHLQAYRGPLTPALWYYEGAILCRKYRADRTGAGYLRGRNALENAAGLDLGNMAALVRLAETWVGIDDDRAEFLYDLALSLDAGDPRAWAGYVDLKAVQERSLGFVRFLRTSLEAAVRRCHERLKAASNVPSTYFALSKFYLLLGRTFEGLDACAKALRWSRDAADLDAALTSAQRLTAAGDLRPDLEAARRMVLLVRAARSSPPDPVLAPLASPAAGSLGPPVIIVPGGGGPEPGDLAALLGAFQGFEGTVLCTGGWVSDLAAPAPGRVRALAYPADPSAGFTPLDPVQAWIDLLAARVHPSRVKVLGTRRGPETGFEYRLALLLGAEVGLAFAGGRAAEELTNDPGWKGVTGLAVLPPDLPILRAFLQRAYPSAFTPEQRELLARRAYEVLSRRGPGWGTGPTSDLVAWEALDEDLKEANRQMIDQMVIMLRGRGMTTIPLEEADARLWAWPSGSATWGMTTTPLEAPDAPLFEFAPEEVEALAEAEHARWFVERALAGWRLGPKDAARKSSPYLVPWADLPEDSKQWDRETVLAMPRLLKELGFGIGASMGTNTMAG